MGLEIIREPRAKEYSIVHKKQQFEIHYPRSKLELDQIVNVEHSTIHIWYSVTTNSVFEYFSEITNELNLNSTIWSQLFKYQIIRIIWSNSGLNQYQSFTTL